MNGIIEINNLHRKYGKTVALRGISLSIKRGEMFGFVGPDGAGKTTTIRIMCGLLYPSEGTVRLFDEDIREKRNSIQKRIGYLSQKFSLYGDLTVDENIEFFAEIHDVTDYKKRREELLEFTRLKPFRKRLAEKLSGGMKQKLALACSLIHKPEILFLDEPTTGVDPVSRRDFWKILADLIKEKITIVMATPYLDEAERCSRVAMFNNGEIIACDTPGNIKKSIGLWSLEIVCKPIKIAHELLSSEINNDIQLFGDRINVLVNNHEEADSILRILNSANVEVIDSRLTEPSIENVFMNLIKHRKLSG
ncbi:ABC transporter ATP-binding protein [Melioribacter sp. OK-6-Me]|uniref:ABC transporter ATP-binding protein n=1 Tax=unclassified Melioribacter TaxID=2627329 RepID=UPI003EDA8FEB